MVAMKKEPFVVSKYRYVIGIDAGTKTGIAVWDRKLKKLMRLETMKIHAALTYVKQLTEWQEQLGEFYLVIVEDARKKGWYTKDKSEALARAQGVGSVRRDATIWEEALTDWKVDFQMVAPKNGMVKLDAKQFELRTGWKGKSSNHARDAAMLVYGY